MPAHRKLIKGGTIVTMDGALGEFQGDILIVGEEIVTVQAGTIDEPVDEVIDATGMIVMPGLVDTHIHLWEMPLRGLSHDIDHASEYFTKVYGRRGLLTPDDVYAGVYGGALELISNGTTTVLDYCHCIGSVPHGDRAVAGLRDAGIRGVHGHSVGVRPRPNLETPLRQRLDDAREVYEALKQDNPQGLLSMRLGHTERFSGATGESIREEAEFAKDLGIGTTAHSLQSHQAVALNQAGGVLGPDFLFVHGTPSTEEDLDALEASGSAVSFTPSMEFNRELAADMLRSTVRRGITLSWGVDVPAFAAPDLFAQMQLVIQMMRHHDVLDDRANARGIRRTDEGTLTAATALKIGTQGGADSLGLGSVIGSLTPGKKADVVILRLPLGGDSVGNTPAHIIFQSGARDVDTVLINGEVRKRAGEMLDVDAPRVRGLLTEARERILAQPVDPNIEWQVPFLDWRSLAR